jgi:hypothetical protein
VGIQQTLEMLDIFQARRRCRSFCDRKTTPDEFFKSSSLAALQLSQFFFNKTQLDTEVGADA